MIESEAKYLKLRKTIDNLCDQLHSFHKNHMKCQKGCDFCCMAYEVFPIELDYIQKSIKNEQIETGTSENASCIFLKDHVCQIYEHRPIICRTHGLPLLFMNDEHWELSACELNFTEFSNENFTAENTFPQDKFNSQLFMLNKAYLKEIQSDKGEFDLIPLNRILSSK